MQGRRTIIIPAVVLLCSIGAAARAQTSSNPEIPKGAQVDRPDASESLHGMMAVPLPELAPPAMPGGLYRLANGYLSCPDALPVTNGQPNLRSCTYIKDVH